MRSHCCCLRCLCYCCQKTSRLKGAEPGRSRADFARIGERRRERERERESEAGRIRLDRLCEMLDFRGIALSVSEYAPPSPSPSPSPPPPPPPPPRCCAAPLVVLGMALDADCTLFAVLSESLPLL
jgi:hypothetical protein